MPFLDRFPRIDSWLWSQRWWRRFQMRSKVRRMIREEQPLVKDRRADECAADQEYIRRSRIEYQVPDRFSSEGILCDLCGSRVNVVMLGNGGKICVPCQKAWGEIESDLERDRR